jgi:hypothetical protein
VGRGDAKNAIEKGRAGKYRWKEYLDKRVLLMLGGMKR